jgi:hypothetical protein
MNAACAKAYLRLSSAVAIIRHRAPSGSSKERSLMLNGVPAKVGVSCFRHFWAAYRRGANLRKSCIDETSVAPATHGRGGQADLEPNNSCPVSASSVIIMRERAIHAGDVSQARTLSIGATRGPSSRGRTRTPGSMWVGRAARDRFRHC